MQISQSLLTTKLAELAQRLALDPAHILCTQDRGTAIRVPLTLDPTLFNTAFLQTFPAVGMYDRRTETAHHLIRIYDLKLETS